MPSPTFSVEGSSPTFRWNRGSMIVPSDSRHSRPLRHALADLRNHLSSRAHPSTSIVSEESDRCVTDGVTRLESLHAPTENVHTLSHGFGLQRTQLTSTPASRASATDENVFHRWVGRPSRTDPLAEEHQCSEPLPGLCTAPVRTNRSHTLFRPFGLTTELTLLLGGRSPNSMT